MNSDSSILLQLTQAVNTNTVISHQFDIIASLQSISDIERDNDGHPIMISTANLTTICKYIFTQATGKKNNIGNRHAFGEPERARFHHMTSNGDAVTLNKLFFCKKFYLIFTNKLDIFLAFEDLLQIKGNENGQTFFVQARNLTTQLIGTFTQASCCADKGSHIFQVATNGVGAWIHDRTTDTHTVVIKIWITTHGDNISVFQLKATKLT